MHPLKVRDGDAAGVGQDVGNDKDPVLLEDYVGRRSRRPIGSLGQNLCLDVAGVLRGDLVLQGSRNQDLAFLLQELFVGDGIGAGIAPDAASFHLVPQHLYGIQTLGCVDDAALGIRDGDHLGAVLME